VVEGNLGMGVRSAGIALIIALGLGCAAFEGPRAGDSAKRKLISDAESLKTDQRIAVLEKVLKAEPKDPALKVALAKAFVQKLRETGDLAYLNRASSIVDEVLASEPKFEPAKRLRNEVEMNLHRFPKVADYAETMLATNPSDSSTLGLLGDAFMEMGQYQRAGEAYTRMASLGGNLFSYNRLAYYNFVTGKADEALGWIAQAIAAGGKSPENEAWCLSEMGDILFKVGRIGDAESAFQLALKTFPGYHRGHAGLGRVQAAQERWADAIQNFQRAQAIVPLPEYAGSLEMLFERTGNASGAAKQRALMDMTEKLLSANGEKANRTLALIYADENRNLPRALELAKAEFDVRNDVYSYDALSWVLYKNGQLVEAAKASDRALAMGTPEPAFYYHAGVIALAKGDRENARKYLERALSLNPKFDVRNGILAQKALEEIEPRPAGERQDQPLR
jgi:tetratricopeptide (TPR) repeat protein